MTVSIVARDAREEPARAMEVFPQPQVLARPKELRIAFKEKGRILFINPGDVVAIQAEGNYVSLLRESISHLLRESISVVAEKLEPYGFIRIHRSVLINAEFVEEVRPLPTGEYCLAMRGGSEHTVTRKYKKNLKAIAGAWIGVEGFVDK